MSALDRRLAGGGSPPARQTAASRGRKRNGSSLSQRRYLRSLYWWSFFIRFSVGMFGWGLVMIDAPIDIVQDAAFYEETGSVVAREWLAGRKSESLEMLMNRSYFPWLIVVGIACFYTLTLGLRLLPLLIAAYCAITAFVPGLVYQSTRIAGGGHRAGAIAAWLVLFCPAFVFWSSALYKEGLILFFLALAALHVLKLQQRFTGHSMTILLSCLLALTALRFYLALIIAVGTALGLMFVRVHRGSGSSVIVRQVLAFTILGTMAITAYGLGHFHEEIPMSLDEGLYKVEDVRRGLSLADSGYLHNADVSSMDGAIDAMPTGIGYFLTVPWPNQRGSLRHMMAIPDTTLWVGLYVFVLLGLGQALTRNPQCVLFLLACTIGMTCFYGICIGNVGTAYRMRIQVWLFWCPFVGIAIESMIQQQRAIRPRWTRRRPSRTAHRGPARGSAEHDFRTALLGGAES